MNQSVFDLTQQHRSVRQFKDEPLSKETVEKLVKAGQMASTSSYVQAYSIIGITDPEIKQALKEVSGQQHVVDNGYLFVYVIDYYRHSLINQETQGNMQPSFESAEGLLVGTIDVALAAQNVALTAEDMGLGIVYLGSLRNDVGRVSEILNLPEHVFPLFVVWLSVFRVMTIKVHLSNVYHLNMSSTKINIMPTKSNNLLKLNNMTKISKNIMKSAHKVNVQNLGQNKLRI